MMLELKSLGSRIKTHRHNKNLTIEKLAEKAGISSVFMSDIERGNKTPSIRSFVRIANALGVTADALLCDSIDEDKDMVVKDFEDSFNRRIAGLSTNKINTISRVVDMLIKELGRY